LFHFRIRLTTATTPTTTNSSMVITNTTTTAATAATAATATCAHTTHMDLSSCLALLKFATSSSSSYIASIKTLLGILDRIISQPDDKAARRLRITHPVLKTKLTGQSGGIELLICLGFAVVLTNRDAPAVEVEAEAETNGKPGKEDVQTVSVAAPSSASGGGDTTSASANPTKIPLMECKGVDLFPKIAPYTSWEVFLEMEEPPIDSLATSIGDSDTSGNSDGGIKLSWLDWFDGLKEHRDRLTQALKE